MTESSMVRSAAVTECQEHPSTQCVCKSVREDEVRVSMQRVWCLNDDDEFKKRQGTGVSLSLS